MKVTIKAGTKGWIEDSVGPPTAITFREDTVVEVEPTGQYWYKVMGSIPDFPKMQSNILINKVNIDLQ